MSLLGTIIGAGASLLGGIFGKKKQAKTDDTNLAAVRETNAANRQMARETNEFNERMIREQNEYNDPSNIRRRAEAAGFNPLQFIGPGVGLQSSVASGAMSTDQPGVVSSHGYMGAAIADAGLILADGISKNFERSQVQRLQEQNKELQDKLNQQTLRPKVGGVYAQREMMPTLRRAHGVADADSSQAYSGQLGAGGGAGGAVSGAGGARELSDKLPVDPRREVDNAPVTSTSGFMVVDNPHLPFRLYSPTLDGDEPLQWYDYPSVVPPLVFGAGSYAYDKIKAGEWDPSPSRYLKKTSKRLKESFW